MMPLMVVGTEFGKWFDSTADGAVSSTVDETIRLSGGRPRRATVFLTMLERSSVAFTDALVGFSVVPVAFVRSFASDCAPVDPAALGGGAAMRLGLGILVAYGGEESLQRD